MEFKIAVLPGDGIGPEVMEGACRVLQKAGDLFGHSFILEYGDIGGAAFERHGVHFPEDTKSLCRRSDAVLFGSVGGPSAQSTEPKWKDCERNSLLALRKEFNFSINLRPIKTYPELKELSPLKNPLMEKGVDILIVRELLGDLYFGEHRFYTEDNKRCALDTAIYTEDQIRSAVKTAFTAAASRSGRVTSVDKANVLNISRLWREIVHEEAANFKEIELEDMLVDNFAMQLIRNPARFDVVVTSNMFGDIISDLGAVIPGSLGLTPSASLNGDGFGMFEPSGGSAPDIAGSDSANPIAQILSAALMLKYALKLEKEALSVERAVASALAEGYRTPDIQTPNGKIVGTREMSGVIISGIA